MKAFVTGGAGFIGSHIVDELVRLGHDVTVYDNLSSGFRRHVAASCETGGVRFIEGDILDQEALTEAMHGSDTVFHLAANADVRGGKTDTAVDLHQNIIGTHRVMEAMRLTGGRRIMFTSSATVYGEPDVFPTPETYAALQTSLYGASKAAAECMIQAYCEYFDMKSYIFRFVSWIGERYSHGVVFDFINKLRRNSRELEILGDGNQKKSYLHVDDGVTGIFLAMEKLTGAKNVLNLGHEQFMNVVDLAKIVCDEMRLKDVRFRFTGGARGWVGDSPFVHLDISRMKAVGFEPRVSIEDGIRRTARYLLTNEWLLDAK